MAGRKVCGQPWLAVKIWCILALHTQLLCSGRAAVLHDHLIACNGYVQLLTTACAAAWLSVHNWLSPQAPQKQPVSLEAGMGAAPPVWQMLDLVAACPVGAPADTSATQNAGLPPQLQAYLFPCGNA